MRSNGHDYQRRPTKWCCHKVSLTSQTGTTDYLRLPRSGMSADPAVSPCLLIACGFCYLPLQPSPSALTSLYLCPSRPFQPLPTTAARLTSSRCPSHHSKLSSFVPSTPSSHPLTPFAGTSAPCYPLFLVSTHSHSLRNP
jgi:hypothetical protein